MERAGRMFCRTLTLATTGACGTGTSAKLACLAADGELAGGDLV